MKHQDFKTAIKMTARTLPVCSAWLASAEAASAISNRYVGINLNVDAVTPKPAPLGHSRAEANTSAPFCVQGLHEK